MLQEEGVFDEADEGPVFYMNSYFICHLTNRRQDSGRPLRFDIDIDSWERDMRFIWEDLANPALPIFVHIVQPDPPVTRRPGTFGTLLIVQNPTPFRAACLTTSIEPALPRNKVEEIARSFDSILPYRHVLFHAGASDVCDDRRARGIGACDILVGRRMLPQGQPVRICDGLGLVINIPPPLQPDEWEQRYLTGRGIVSSGTDDVSMTFRTQTSSSSSEHRTRDQPQPVPQDAAFSTDEYSSYSNDMSNCTDDWRDFVVFTIIPGSTVQLSLPWHDEGEFYRLIQDAFAFDEHNIVHVHHMQSTPGDIAETNHECLLVQTVTDPPSADILRLILVDIEVYTDEHNTPLVFARRACWLPETATRLTVFRLLGVEEHFWADPDRAHLWLNFDWIAQDNPMPLTLHHGHYLVATIGEEALIGPLSPNDFAMTSEVEDSSDDVQDLQDGTSSLFHHELRLTRRSPYQCQSDHNSTSYSTVDSPIHTLTHRQRPRRRFFSTGWNTPLENHFATTATVEMEEEGRVAYINHHMVPQQTYLPHLLDTSNGATHRRSLILGRADH